MAQAMLVNAYLLNNQFEETKEALKTAIEIDEQLAYTYFCLGTYYWSTADFTRAFAAYKMASELEPQFVPYKSYLGLLAIQSDNYKAAGEYFQAILDHAPDSMPGILGMIYTATEQHDYTLAEEWIEKAKAIDDEEPNIYIAMGEMFYDHEVYSDALDMHKQALEFDPESEYALLSLGTAYIMIDAYNQADEKFRELACLFPHNSDALKGKGWVKFYEGDDREALKAFRNALALNPYNVGALFGLGLVNFFLGDDEGAEQSLAQALIYSAGPSYLHSESGYRFAIFPG